MATATAMPKPAATATPGAAGGATPAPGVTGGAKPTPAPTFAPVPLTLLRGKVLVDASYMVAAGAGNLIGMDGGSLVGNSGNTIVAAGAGNMVAAGAGNLIGLDGGSLIGQDGGSLIGEDGSSLIGMDGGSLVAAGAGNAVGTNKFRLTAYGLLADTPPPPGTMLPAANMVVCLFDMATGERAIATRDQAVQDRAYVLTNAQGEYVAPVRAAIANNVVVMAEPPKNVDARLRVSAIARPDAKGAQADLDAANALTAYFLRKVFAERMQQYVLKFDGNDGIINFGSTPVPPAQQELANRSFGRLVKAATQTGLNNRTSEHAAIAQRMADAILADLDVGELPINPQWSPEWKPETPDQAAGTEKAAKAVADETNRFLVAAAERLKADPAYFTEAAADKRGVPQHYLTSLHQCGFKIITPADAVRFWIEAYVSDTSDGRYSGGRDVFADLGLTANQLSHHKVGGDAYVMWVFLQMALDAPSPGNPDGLLSHLESIIRTSQPDAPRVPAPQ